MPLGCEIVFSGGGDESRYGETETGESIRSSDSRDMTAREMAVVSARKLAYRPRLQLPFRPVAFEAKFRLVIRVINSLSRINDFDFEKTLTFNIFSTSAEFSVGPGLEFPCNKT